MNEELQKGLVEIVSLTKEGILKSAQIIQEQAPELAEQILKYNFWASFIPWICFICITLIIIIIGIVLVCVGIKKKETEYIGIGAIATGLALGFCFIPILLLFSDMDWLQIWIAPKLYLVEYVTDLIK